MIVVKVGGAVVGAELGELEDAVVVHGGGQQISAAMARAGLEVTFVGGRRVTDARAIEVVRQALLDVNRQLCARDRAARRRPGRRRDRAAGDPRARARRASARRCPAGPRRCSTPSPTG